VRRIDSGPSGQVRKAFLLCSRDEGATWKPVALVRTIRSHIRFWGYPVWPPERIDAIVVERGLLRVGFRDEWVPFEPGGESLWMGTYSSSRSLWTVKRVRRMDYDGLDVPNHPPPIEVELPPGFAPPSLSLLDDVASRVSAPAPRSMVDRYAWVPSLPVGIVAVTTGSVWTVLAVVAVTVVSLPLISILLERRRCRRVLEG
jgi:hypothetical protein